MAHPLACFQRIFVINLPARTDRRREMAAQFEAIGLGPAPPLVRFVAARRPEAAAGFPSIGARGCFLSHLEVLRRARDQGLTRLLVCEDDLNFAPGFNRRMTAVAARLAGADWSLFYGGYAVDALPGRPGPDGLLAVPADFPVQTSHFLALNGQATIAACIAHLEALLGRPPGDRRGGPMHVDGAYNWFRQAHPRLRTLLAVPVLGYQRHSRTDIHDLKWFDRLPLAREAAAWLRQRRNP